MGMNLVVLGIILIIVGMVGYVFASYMRDKGRYKAAQDGRSAIK
jgi:hypothetical protein